MDARASVSPAKRRAALAPLDANAMPVVASPKLAGLKHAVPKTAASPVKDAAAAAAATLAAGTKRRAETDAEPDADASPAPKKTCLERDEVTVVQDVQPQRPSREHSPDSVSVFDTSAGDGDASWATAATEPDVVSFAAVARPARGSMTREQAREKAEILRLRLGLASYKVRTGQTAVPLADLQPRPLPGPRRTVRVQSPPAESPLPRQRAAASPSRTPPRAGPGPGLPSSALRGGAASGLLSLARGQHAS